jgi:amino acid adenylation domain-containing protein
MFDLNLHVTEMFDQITCVLEYCTELFKKPTMQRFVSYFNKIVSDLILQPEKKLFELEIIPQEEKQQILYDFNNTPANYSTDRTLEQVFEEQSQRTPNHIALVFDDKEMSYKELNRRANQLARRLRETGITSFFVGVIIDRTIEMIIAVMGILKAGGAYVPLEPYLPDARIFRILSSLKVTCVLTNHYHLQKLAVIARELPELTHVFCLDEGTEGTVAHPKESLLVGKTVVIPREINRYPDHNLSPLTQAEDVAYVIYTSGSTGLPKGVVVKHKPVINVIEWVKKTFHVGIADKLLFIASLSFDLSVYDIFGILACGGCIRVASHADIRNPQRLLEIMLDEGITFWDSAPAALQQLVPLFSEVRNELETHRHHLRLVFLSGDWIPVTLPVELRKTFIGVKVIGLGGATEATIWSNYYPIGVVDPFWNSIPYGKPIQNAKYYILDQYLRICPIGVAGDLYIGGQCLATGYINDVELTSVKFLDNPFVQGKIIYKTGDVARWFEDGNMEFLGRLDNQVKLRGLRIELGEIENQLLNHDKVAEAIVIIRGDKAEDKYLCAYIVPDPEDEDEISDNELQEYLTKELPDYMIPSYFVTLENMPLSPNGKRDRKSLPEPDKISSKSDEQYIAPRNFVEKKLAHIWAEVLEIEEDRISINSNFFEIGGNSLKSIKLISNIHKELEVKISLVKLFAGPELRKIAEFIREAKRDKFITIEAIEQKEYYVLSAAQCRVYITQQMDLESTAYNIPQMVVLEGTLDLERFEGTCQKLIQRHESFRTSFELVGDEPVQRIHQEVAFSITYFESNEEEVKEFIKSFIGPFDLGRAPLLRVGLITMEEEKHMLMVDMHHIISDGVSMALLMEEFMMLFQGKELLSLRIQYKDFSEWQNSETERKKVKKQEEYWLKQFEDPINPFQLPTDYERADGQLFKGAAVGLALIQQEVEALKEMALNQGVTLYMILLSIYNLLLAKLSGQEDIIVGTVTAGRSHPELQRLMGMFVNTLALRSHVSEDNTFIELLHKVSQRTLEAFDNQDIQFDDLVENVVVTREKNRNPLLDAVFIMDNIELQEIKIPGLQLKPYAVEDNTSKFDIKLGALEKDGDLFLSVEYNATLFKKETVEWFIRYYKDILSSVLKHPDKKLSEIKIISEVETEEILNQFNIDLENE